jgi:hypothetical protein
LEKGFEESISGLIEEPSCNIPGGPEETHENLSQDSRWPSPDFNQELSKYGTESFADTLNRSILNYIMYFYKDETYGERIVKDFMSFLVSLKFCSV